MNINDNKKIQAPQDKQAEYLNNFNLKEQNQNKTQHINSTLNNPGIKK